MATVSQLDGRSRPSRRWLSYSLRALFVIVTFLCIGLAWLAMVVERAQRQKRAVEKIKQLRGYVMFDYGRTADGMRVEGDAYFDADPAQEWVSAEKSWPPAWLRRLIGDEYSRSVTMVNICRREPTPADLELLADLPNLTGLFLFKNLSVNDESMLRVAPLAKLQELDISETSVTDVGLAHIVNLRELKRLWMIQSAITDAGMTFVGQLPELELLDVRHSPGITDEGLSRLAGLDNLRELSVAGTAVGDRGLAHLAGLASLRQLDLVETQVQGPGLRHLAAHDKLEGLYLDRTPIDDPSVAFLPEFSSKLTHLGLAGTKISEAGLAEIAKLTSLEWLSLVDTHVTDAGLEHLAKLTGLQELWLPGKNVTPAGIARLQLALPKCKISTQ